MIGSSLTQTCGFCGAQFKATVTRNASRESQEASKWIVGEKISADDSKKDLNQTAFARIKHRLASMWTRAKPMAHSSGRASTPRQAKIMLAVSGVIIVVMVYVTAHGGLSFYAKKKPLNIPVVSQPDASVEKVNGVPRLIKVYPLYKVQAAYVKKSLDHVLRQSSLTTQVVASPDNALEIKATSLDHTLAGALIPKVDIDYGGLKKEQIIFQMIGKMTTERGLWIRQHQWLLAPAAEKVRQTP